MAQILAALPFGRLWAWPIWCPACAGWPAAAYDLFARNRTRISGLAGARGLRRARGSGRRARGRARHRSPVGAWLRARLPLVRELAVALTLVVLAAEVSVANPAVPPALRWTSRPQWMADAVMYTRAVPELGAVLARRPPHRRDGGRRRRHQGRRHVDPYNQVGSRVAACPSPGAGAPRTGPFFCDYTLRIPEAGWYHQAFVEWVVRHPERTGHPQDAIASFEAYVVQQTSPAPGEDEPRDVQSQVFVRWPAGGRR